MVKRRLVNGFTMNPPPTECPLDGSTALFPRPPTISDTHLIQEASQGTATWRSSTSRRFSTNWRIRTCTSPRNWRDTVKTRRSFTGVFASRLNRSRWVFLMSKWHKNYIIQKKKTFSYFICFFSFLFNQDVFEKMDGAKLSLLKELLARNSVRGASSCCREEETDAEGKSNNNECEATSSPGQIPVKFISSPKTKVINHCD